MRQARAGQQSPRELYLCPNFATMRAIPVMFVLLMLQVAAFSQTPSPAIKGATYGAGTTSLGAIPAAELSSNLTNNTYSGKITGKVVEVCQEKGCWMKLQTENGETMMVKFKDYGFFMPKDIQGKEVVLDGEAQIKEVSVKQQKHYAKDAGKSEQEIKKITAPKKELQFVANGVLVL